VSNVGVSRVPRSQPFGARVLGQSTSGDMFERNRRGPHAIAAAVLVGGMALQPARSAIESSSFESLQEKQNVVRAATSQCELAGKHAAPCDGMGFNVPPVIASLPSNLCISPHNKTLRPNVRYLPGFNSGCRCE
jgi:hypothetical protein